MRPNRILVLLLLVLCSVVISFVGCAKIKIQTPESMACNVPPFDQQSSVHHVLEVVNLRGKINASGEIRGPEEEFKVHYAENLLTQATKVAREGKGNDFACKINLSIDPTVVSNGEFRKAELTPEASECVKRGIICTKDDFETVIGMEPPGIKLVNRIDWCGKPALGTYYGCSKGGSIIVESACLGGGCPKNEAVLWLHELGHTLGLPDRPNSDPRPVVMRSIIEERNTGLTKCDCMRFRKNRQR